MAEPNPKKKKFQKVTASHKVSGGALRDDPAVKVEPSGRSECNRGASDLLDQLADTDADDYMVYFGADRKTKTVAVYVGGDDEDGAMRIRRYAGKGGSRISFHMGGVWKQHPSLRPSSTAEYKVKLDTDEEGTPYMEINLKARHDVRKGRKSDSDESTGSNDASAQKKPASRGKSAADEKTNPASEPKKADPDKENPDAEKAGG